MTPGDGATGWLLRQFDTAWALAGHHLETLATEECHWRPADPCLHVRVDDDGLWHADWPAHEGYDIGPPSIAWTGWHMLYWWTKALQHLDGLTGLEPADICWPGDADRFRAALAGLQARWRARLAAASAADLATPLATPWPQAEAGYATVAAWLNLELMKNAAEIGYARFLYAARRPPA